MKRNLSTESGMGSRMGTKKTEWEGHRKNDLAVAFLLSLRIYKKKNVDY